MDRFVERIVKKSVALLDNSPIHKSRKLIAKIEEWNGKEKISLISFYLPIHLS
jgi:hypothetical protein